MTAEVPIEEAGRDPLIADLPVDPSETIVIPSSVSVEKPTSHGFDPQPARGPDLSNVDY